MSSFIDLVNIYFRVSNITYIAVKIEKKEKREQVK